MQRITILSLALAMSLCLQTRPIFAQDQGPNQGDTKGAKDAHHGSKETAHATKDIQKETPKVATSGVGKSHAKMSKSEAAVAFRSNNTTSQGNSAAIQSSQQSVSRQSSRQSTQSFAAVQGNQSNHYNGQWSSASSHSDWDQQTTHHWRDHDYRWYDGGWLIIETGPSPGYASGGSTGSNVQERLAQQGYYNGPIDGEIGRGTRNAIAHYESDNGLQVNGVIDEPLLVSLRLE